MNHFVSCGLILALAVGLGAFGAHGLKPHLTATQLGWWSTANDYHFWHGFAFGLLALGGRGTRNLTALRWSARLFLLGLILFCGSLYTMALTNLRWLGMITPIGGLAFIAGWICFALAFRKQSLS